MKINLLIDVIIAIERVGSGRGKRKSVVISGALARLSANSLAFLPWGVGGRMAISILINGDQN